LQKRAFHFISLIEDLYVSKNSIIKLNSRKQENILVQQARV